MKTLMLWLPTCNSSKLNHDKWRSGNRQVNQGDLLYLLEASLYWQPSASIGNDHGDSLGCRDRVTSILSHLECTYVAQ